MYSGINGENDNLKRINTEAIKPITYIKLKAFIVLMDDLDSFML
ncbi:hypothetical protein ZPR_4537 [Zunongwangia profunda SM-A87]|uniref:Uncharacterized protein n=1 Tax=Zunongwangia profunda (strain DSM 18752 / CCTCC AB 206139 / SM-A87) TaxID=655815 RepID=D5BDD2_ZUNPS|nr:hypothetical protein ZPR_4537 [Zunongwangia profunda SM-A87]